MLELSAIIIFMGYLNFCMYVNCMFFVLFAAHFVGRIREIWIVWELHGKEVFFSGKEKIVWHRDEKFLKQQQRHLSPNKPTAEKTHASKLLAYRGEICRQKVLLGKNVTVSIKTLKYFFGSVFSLKCKGISVTPTVLCSNLANF